MRVMTLICFGLGICLSAAFPGAAVARDYPWCVASTSFSGQDCSFVTKAQCDISAFGFSYCIRNSAVEETPPPEQRRRAKRVSR